MGECRGDDMLGLMYEKSYIRSRGAMLSADRVQENLSTQGISSLYPESMTTGHR